MQEQVRICERNNPADIQASEEGRERGATDTRAELQILEHGKDHGEEGCSPPQTTELYRIHVALGSVIWNQNKKRNLTCRHREILA